MNEKFKYAVFGLLAGFLIGVVGMYKYHSDKISEARIEALEKIDELHEENLAIEAKYKLESEEYEKTIRNLRSDIAANRLQFYAKAKSVTTSESGETRCELDTETSQRLISITEDGDRNTRELNQCIETYNKVRDLYK